MFSSGGVGGAVDDAASQVTALGIPTHNRRISLRMRGSSRKESNRRDSDSDSISYNSDRSDPESVESTRSGRRRGTRSNLVLFKMTSPTQSQAKEKNRRSKTFLSKRRVSRSNKKHVSKIWTSGPQEVSQIAGAFSHHEGDTPEEQLGNLVEPFHTNAPHQDSVLTDLSDNDETAAATTIQSSPSTSIPAVQSNGSTETLMSSEHHCKAMDGIAGICVSPTTRKSIAKRILSPGRKSHSPSGRTRDARSVVSSLSASTRTSWFGRKNSTKRTDDVKAQKDLAGGSPPGGKKSFRLSLRIPTGFRVNKKKGRKSATRKEKDAMNRRELEQVWLKGSPERKVARSINETISPEVGETSAAEDPPRVRLDVETAKISPPEENELELSPQRAVNVDGPNHIIKGEELEDTACAVDHNGDCNSQSGCSPIVEDAPPSRTMEVIKHPLSAESAIVGAEQQRSPTGDVGYDIHSPISSPVLSVQRKLMFEPSPPPTGTTKKKKKDIFKGMAKKRGRKISGSDDSTTVSLASSYPHMTTETTNATTKKRRSRRKRVLRIHAMILVVLILATGFKLFSGGTRCFGFQRVFDMVPEHANNSTGGSILSRMSGGSTEFYDLLQYVEKYKDGSTRKSFLSFL